MQVIRLVDPVPDLAVARDFLRMLRVEFPELLVHRGEALWEDEPALGLRKARADEELTVEFSGAGEGLSWPAQRDEIERRLAEWVGPVAASASQEPAHTMWVALATRIATRRLHLRSGDEETAVLSMVALFRRARELMEEHREATEFGQVALALLNDLLRPYTARWHRWMSDDGTAGADGKAVPRFRDERYRRTFREELRELQPRALGFQKVFAALARGRKPEQALLTPDEPLLDALRAECDLSLPPVNLGAPFAASLREEVKLRLADEHGRSERTFDPLREEANAIRARRRELFPSENSDVMSVAGLALSGGGIRSATFCLGIVQGLQARGLFAQFDYLSTVSGGGYLGTFLSCYLGWDPANQEAGKTAPSESGKPAEGAAAPPPASTPSERLREAFERPKQAKDDATGVDGSSESLALRHLRNNSRYLLNGGATGLLRILGVLLTGFSTSFIILLTLPLLGAWLLLGLQRWRMPGWWMAAGERVPWIYLGLAAVAVVTAVGFLLSSRGPKETAQWNKSNRVRIWVAFVLLSAWSIGTAFYLGSWLYPRWEAWMFPAPTPIWPAWSLWSSWPTWATWPAWPKHEVWSQFLDQARANRIWPRAVGSALAGTLSLLGIYWIFMPLSQRLAQGARWSAPSTRLRDVAEAATLILFVASGVLFMLFVAPWLVYEYETIRDGMGAWLVAKSSVKLPEYVTTALTGLATFVFGGLAKRNKGKAGFNWAGLLLLFLTPAFFLLSLLVFCSHLGVGGSGDWDMDWAIGLTIAVVVWAWCFLDINTFAPHRYYRNRLCECYLAVKGRSQRSWIQRVIDVCFRGGDFTTKIEAHSVGTLQRLPLSALGGNAAAPYHLINATLNAAASKHPTLRGRDGDFFLFSRYYCGSPLSGYVKTEEIEAADPHVDLGTAMAISGAAASTNMGDMKSAKRYRFLLTLFNVRLGYWLRRPGLKAMPGIFRGPGVPYFLRELVGAVHERSGYVNLSDGGHIENLAVYELLRRECRFIVCVDAGMEPGMECADLMRLQRYAAIDFGIDMQFDPADLTILPTTYSRAYAILVRVDYKPGSCEERLGWMLYIKLAMTGTEPRYVLDYRRENADFPHQTTGDQIYDEAQFEAYRALGECAVGSLFQPEITGGTKPESIEAWFQVIANSLLPDNDPSFSKQKQECHLESKTRSNG